MIPNNVTAAPRPHARFLFVTLLVFLLTILGGSLRIFAQGSSTFAWREVSPNPGRRFEGPALVINNRLVVFGGFDEALNAQTRVDAYDPATDSWSSLSDMPVAVTHVLPVRDGNIIWFVGGFVGDDPGPATAAVWRYDIAGDSWSAGPALPAPRAGGTAAVANGELHYVGGFADRDDTRTEHYVLDLGNPVNWTTEPAMPQPRGHSAGAAVNGIIYVFGGQIRHDTAPVDQSEAFAYDTVSNNWQQVANLPSDRSHFEPGTFVYDGRIIIAGGRNNVNFQDSLSDMTMYDPALDLWVALPELPAALLAPGVKRIGTDLVLSNGGFNWDQPQVTTYTAPWLTAWETATASPPAAVGQTATGRIGQEILLLGSGTAAIQLYDLARNSWRTVSSRALPPFPDDGYAAAVFNDELYLFGGLGPAAGLVQIYNPALDSWRLGAPLPFPAGLATATLISNQIYLVGGVVGGVTTPAAARYDPLGNSWASLPALPQGRHYASAGTDGSRLFIFGGREGPLAPNDGTNTVQIFDPLLNTWTSSSDGFLTPLPQARAGMGRALYAGDEFYLLGGETASGAGANPAGVYDRVDIYNPA
ncbi:MAG: hypothetical protein KDE28_18340, partial [Anaerolineales bacterium]|nr:hypothetical protein [Anaerolineales bacterium]